MAKDDDQSVDKYPRLHEDGFIEISGTVDPKQVLKFLSKIKNLKLVEWKFGGCSSNLHTSDVYPQFDDDYYPDSRHRNNGGNYYEHGRHFQYGLPRHQDYHPTRHFQPGGAYYNQPRYVYGGPYLEKRPIEVAGEPDTQPESAVSTTVPNPEEKKCGSCCNVM